MTTTWPLARRGVPEREAFAFASTVLFIVFVGDGFPNFVGWAGWAIVCSLAGIWGITIWMRSRASLMRFPRLLGVFLLFSIVSVAWSHWRIPTVASFAAQVLCTAMAFVMASTLSWRRIVDALSLALRWVLWGSLALEIVVAVFVRHPIYPVWSHYGGRKVPDAFAATRAELFTGGRIQGLPGNANLLALVALLAAIAVAVQLAEGRMKRVRATGWLVAAAVVFLLTRSSTVIVAVPIVLVVLGAALVVRRIPTERRTRAYLVGLAGVVVVAAITLVVYRPVVHLLGKSTDLTGRGTIWGAVWGLVEQHPVIGWGWIGYWWPDTAPLNTLAVRKGVTYLQAHDAYLDIWMQLGIVGLVLFVLYVGSTLVRSWWGATAIGYGSDLRARAFAPVSLAALLVVTALLVQSFTESRLLYEGNWILFAVIAIKTRIVAVSEEPVSTGDGPRTPLAGRAWRAPSRRRVPTR